MSVLERNYRKETESHNIEGAFESIEEKKKCSSLAKVIPLFPPVMSEQYRNSFAFQQISLQSQKGCKIR